MKTNPFAWSRGPHGPMLRAYIVPNRSVIAADLRTPKYRPRVITDRKKQASKHACRNPKE